MRVADECGGAEVIIREFMEGDDVSFRRLNEEWITRYFVLEPKDEYALADPRRTILDGGGRIFFAVRNGEAVGCCALLVMDPGEFEVAKMAVAETSQRAGVGRRLLEEAIAAARAAGATRLSWKPIESSGQRFGYMNRWAFGIFRPSAWFLPLTRVRMSRWNFIFSVETSQNRTGVHDGVRGILIDLPGSHDIDDRLRVSFWWNCSP